MSDFDSNEPVFPDVNTTLVDPGDAEFDAVVLELSRANRTNYIKVTAGFLLIAIGIVAVFSLVAFLPF